MAVAQLRADILTARLADVTVPAGADWAATARQQALERVTTLGLPHRRDEYWRYTNPATLVQPEAPAAAVFAATEQPMFDAVDCLKLVFVDGHFDPDQSDALVQDGLEIALLSEATTTKDHWIKDVYGVLEAHGQSPVPRGLAALNTAMATDGVVIRASRPCDRPVHLIYQQTDPLSDAVLHHVVQIGAGASLTLLESGTAAARLSQVTEVDLADRAQFHHVRTQGRSHQRRAVTHCFAKVGADSRFKSFTLGVNGALSRNECIITMAGADSSAHVAAATVGDGVDFHHDDTVFVTHAAVRCESRQVFKKVLRNGATGVFQGKILVKAGAQKTDGYQISQALLLDDDSQFLAKPELEIYADDVVCSHGSTSGAIDETALFYLRSRGVPAAQAADLLVLAFLAEALDEVEDPALSADLHFRLEGWLERRRR